MGIYLFHPFMLALAGYPWFKLVGRSIGGFSSVPLQIDGRKAFRPPTPTMAKGKGKGGPYYSMGESI